MIAKLRSGKKLAIGMTAIIVGLAIMTVAIYSFFHVSDSVTSGIRTDLKYPAVAQEDIDRAKSQVDKDLTYDIVSADPVAYKNKVIQWPAKVFTAPEKSEDTVYLQVYVEEDDKPYIVSYTNPAFDIEYGDHLLVTGVVAGSLDGENMFGANSSRVAIKANYVEESDRATLFEPEIDSKVVNQASSQNDFTVTVDRIVRAKNETRLYISVKNDSAHEVSFYPGSTKIVQQNKQYEEMSVLEHESMSTSYKPGVEASGSIVFPRLNSLDAITVYLDEPYASGQYDLDWSEIVLDI